ncbi:MFS transporter [Streptomyces sp. NBC_01508]|uniref:MFS transporter n=1 Tax=Streptomyces sp. NBC_01508 TaxID=2903888 RepID=UPI00386358B7
MTGGPAVPAPPRIPGLFSAPYRACTLAVGATFVLIAFAGLALSTAMPVAVQDLDGLPLYALAFGGFLATSVVGTALAGGWADRRGPAPALYAGLACFAVGSVLAGVAGSILPFLAGRLVQGLGAGAVTVALYVVVGHGYPTELRPRMFSLVTACWIVPSMLGPAVAGHIAQTYSWRWVFHGLALLTLVSLAVLARPLAALPGAGTDGGTDSGTEAEANAKANAEAKEQPAGAARVLPAVSVALGAGLLQYAGGAGTSLLRVPAALAGLCLIALGLRRLLPPGTLTARRGIPSLVLLRGLSAAAYFTVESYLPLMLVNERRWSPTAAALSLTGAALTWALASWLQGRPTLRWSRERLVFTGALIHLAGAAVTLSGVLTALPAATAGAGLVVSAFGMGLLLPGVGILTLEHSERGRQGVNSAALQLADSLCSVLLIGLCGALFSLAHTRAGQDAFAFSAVFLTAVCVTAVACPLARRIGLPRTKETLHAPL